MPQRKPKTLKAVRPNVGIRAAYRRRLCALIEEMAASYEHWLRAQYRQTPPTLATDAVPSKALQDELNKLGARWQDRFDKAAPKLGEWFAKSAATRSQAALKKILKDAGMTVEFKLTKGMRDVLHATVAENVGLIRSISQQYHTEVQGMVMRSVTTGRDLGQLTKDLQKRYGITDRRAAFIARDQNNKATAVFTRVRQQEIGITEAIWLHSHGGKTPRRTHLANDGNRYNITEGWFDPDPKVQRRIWPGELVSCRCVAKPIVKGFS